MGKNNRVRRAAKVKRRAREHDQRGSRHTGSGGRGGATRSAEPLLSDAEMVEGLLDLAVAAPLHSDAELGAHAVAALCTLDPLAVRPEAERQALRSLSTAWNGGWQPIELIRQVRRSTDAPTGRLALVTIAADHAGRAASTLDARWVAQLDELDIPRVASGTGWLAGWALREEMIWPEQVGSIVTLLQALAMLYRIPILIPPPGARRDHDALIDLTSTVKDPMLDRVRALLAQAESTSFEAEAEAFTAKAQELMTRHAIDIAMVSASAQRSERPRTIRIAIDEPYVDAKSLLLQLVAEHSRCQAVFHQRYAMSSVVGFAGDLTATEMLFTSLLVQAQVAMQAAATSAPPGARARSRAFRSAFLLAYSQRVSERLAQINAHVVADAEAETSRSIMPVLAARSSVIDAAVDELFGERVASAVRGGYDAAGWASGHMAADRARLSFGDLAEQAAGLGSSDVPGIRPSADQPSDGAAVGPDAGAVRRRA